MDIDEVKRAFIKADDLAQKGDKQAAEDAKVFAQYIKSYKPPQEEEEPKKSLTDRTIDNFKGLGAGAYDLARGLAIDMPLNIGMQLGGLVSGEPASVSRQAAKMAAEDATKGITGRDLYPEATQSSTYNMMMYPFEKITEGIDWAGNKIGELTGNKELGEGSKIAMDVGGAVLPIPGARLAGKAFMKGMEKIDPALRDQPPRRMPDLDTETVVGKPQPEPKQYMGPLFENLKDVDTTDVRNPYRDNIQPDMFDSHLELQQLDENRRAPEGYEQALEADRPLKFDEPSIQPLKDPMQEASPQSEFRFGEDPPLKTPQELALDYDPFSLKQPENMAMDPQRKALDIDLLPERVSKDTVVKGQITKYNRLLEEHNRLMDEARTQGLEGTRIKYQELGKTKKAKEQIDALAARLETIQKQMDNLAKQLQRRMEVKHNFLYDEAWPKNKLYSGTKRVNKFDEKGNQIFDTKTDSKSVQGKGKRFEYEVPAQEDTTGVYSEFPPSVEGPAERTTGLTVEKMERPDMQRSPDAKITNSGKIQKTNPFTGLGRRQGGAIDPSVFKEGTESLFRLAKYVPKRILDKLDAWKKSNGSLDYPNLISLIKDSNIKLTEKQREELLALHDKDDAIHTMKRRIDERIARGDLEAAERREKSLDAHLLASLLDNEIKWAAVNSGGAQYPRQKRATFQDAIQAIKDLGDSIAKKEQEKQKQERLSKFRLIDGGKQSGKLDMSVFTEGLGKILAGGKAIAKHAVTRDPNQYKKVPLSQADKIRMITGADARDPKTFVKEVLQNKENLVDISGETYPKGLLRKDLTPSAVGRLTYQNNPVISYISNRLNRIDGATKVAKEMALWGKGFGENWRGKPVKSKSDDGARTIMKTIPRARREGFRAAVNKYMDGKILEQMGLKEPTDSMLKADGLNTREIQSYRAARKQFDNIVDEINKALTAAGNKPIEKRPGYFPAMWMGDYRVFVKNAKGEVVKTLAFDHQFQVDMAIQKVKELDSTLKTEVSDAAKNKYNMKNSDLSAFQLASEVFQHDPKISKALDAARNEILQHRGALRHKLQKKGVEGYMGSEKGGFTDLEKAIDLYIEQAYNFLSDQQKRNMVGEVSKEFTDAGYSIQENLPNTQKYVNDILSNSIGASENMLKGFDRFLEYVGEFIATNGGIGGRRSAQRLLKTFNGIAGFYNLATAKQFAINAVQPLYALAKAQQLKVELGTDNIMMNMAKAYQEAFVHEKVSSMSKESRAALDFARKSGLIDARTLELINANTGEAASNLMKTAGHASSWWEQEAVRVPAYLFYDHMLRETIKKPEDRWEAASQLTEHTMVNYSKTQTPAIYGQMGIAGDAVRPYQQFTHNYHGQFAEYLQLAKREKKFSPLATFLAAQTTMAGLRGVVPLTAAAAFIAAYNSIPGVEELPTPEEALLGSGMSDTWVFGPLSKATGMNLSGSAGAPNILPTPGMPGLSMAGKIGSDVIGGGAKMLMGMDKEEDRMKMAQTLAPSAAKGFVEEAFMKDDGTVPNPRNDGMQSDLPIVRTPEEWRTRKWMGAEPYREGTQKARLRAAESSLKKESDYKNKLLDKIVDDYITKDEFDDKQLEEYLDKGGDPKSVITAVKSKQIKRILSKVESQMKDLPKQQKAKFMDAMEKYQVKLQDMSLEELKQEAE